MAHPDVWLGVALEAVEARTLLNEHWHASILATNHTMAHNTPQHLQQHDVGCMTDAESAGHCSKTPSQHDEAVIKDHYCYVNMVVVEVCAITRENREWLTGLFQESLAEQLPLRDICDIRSF